MCREEDPLTDPVPKDDFGDDRLWLGTEAIFSLSVVTVSGLANEREMVSSWF